jgi:ZIP family zinc transporter
VTIAIAAMTFVSTALGGLFALRHRDRLHLILGFTAGVILSVVAFDLLPEIFDLVRSTGSSVNLPMGALVVAFLLFHIAEKTVLLHGAHEDEYGHGAHGHGHGHAHSVDQEVGLASALALCFHSFTDGLGIGLAFQAGHEVGIAVAVAVIAHDFADGLNTVSLMLAHGNSRRRALTLLALDAVAPFLGVLVTLAISIPDEAILVSLGAFCGVLLYIGAADILPEAHANHPSGWTLACTVLGAAVMFVVLSVAL